MFYGHLSVIIYGIFHINSTVNTLVSNAVKITNLLAEWNGLLFKYTLHWEVPDYIAFGSGIVSQFVLLVTKQYDGTLLETKEIEYVRKQPNQTSYSSTLRKDLEPLPLRHSYKFEVSYTSLHCEQGGVCLGIECIFE